MTDASIIQALTTIFMNLPALILAILAVWKSHKANKSSQQNSVEINGVMDAVKDIKVHINSKMDLLLKTVAEKSLLEGGVNERARRDAQDDSNAKAINSSKISQSEPKSAEVKIDVANVDISKIVEK